MKWAAVALISLVAAAGGYLAGQLTATDERDASQAYKQAEGQAFAASYKTAAAEAKREGKSAGRQQGFKQGASAGRTAGRTAAAKQAAEKAAASSPTSCPPGTGYDPPSDGFEGGCTPRDNSVYENAPRGDDYGDQIPGTPGIQGE